MDDSRFLGCLAVDHAAMRQAAEGAEPAVPVPSCPGWTMADLVSHVGATYLPKAVIMGTGEWPGVWPPPGTEQEPPLALLDRGYAELTGEFSARDPAEPTPP
jgi:Mycothiol maleylpyruvate isomerase N-terminal domain